MNNYEYCANFAAYHAPGGRVLDYGCGQGQIVELLRKTGIDGYGCDVFYDGGNYHSNVPRVLLEGGIIRRMRDNVIPFDDLSFDLVVHNQVFEHVPDLELAVSEIARVLRPGGIMLGLFPDASVWHEGHCGIPFLHWFRKGSKFRAYYAVAFRYLGFGYHHAGKAPLQWSRDFCAWLDNWTYYRPYPAIVGSIGQYFDVPHHIEVHWFDQRVKGLAWIPDAIKRFVVRRRMGMVFWCAKRR
jgi:SAM-dependent methyltransferase